MKIFVKKLKVWSQNIILKKIIVNNLNKIHNKIPDSYS